MSAPLDLSVIIVNWRSAEFTNQCVASIREHTSGLTYEVIVVDNASFDGCDKLLSENAPEVIYRQSNENLGFARGNNLGFEAARGANLLFLNPDTVVLEEAIVRLYDALQRLSGAGAVGARLMNRDGTLQTSCIQSFPTIVNQVLATDVLVNRWPEARLWGAGPLYRPGIEPHEVEVISGACLMVRREVFEKVGRFSEDYFMYAEDLDLCYKVRKAGWKNYYVPEATVIHFGGASSEQASSDFSGVMMRESIWRFLRKTRGVSYGSGYRSAMLASALCRLAALGISLPVQKGRGWKFAWSRSLRKWWAILCWSLRRAEWVKQHGTQQN